MRKSIPATGLLPDAHEADRILALENIMPTAVSKPAKKAVKKAAKKASPLRGRAQVLTPAQRSEDIKQFGKEIRKSKASAVAFLKRAGILDDAGELATPFRS